MRFEAWCNYDPSTWHHTSCDVTVADEHIMISCSPTPHFLLVSFIFLSHIHKPHPSQPGKIKPSFSKDPEPCNSFSICFVEVQNTCTNASVTQSCTSYVSIVNSANGQQNKCAMWYRPQCSCLYKHIMIKPNKRDVDPSLKIDSVYGKEIHIYMCTQ